MIVRLLLATLLLCPMAVLAERPAPGAGDRVSGPAGGPPAIGVLLPLTDRFQPFGEAALRGIRLALGAVGEETPAVRTVVLDTRGEGGGAAEGYRRLAADPGVVAVLGPMLTWEAAAVRDEAAVAGLAAISFSQRAAPSRAPLFRFSMSKEDQAEALANHAVNELGLRRWAILHPEDNYGQDLAGLFRERVERLGGEVRAVVGYDPAKTDFQQDVQRLQGRIGIWRPTGETDAKGEEKKKLELLVDGIFVPDSSERIVLLASHLAFFDIRGAQLLGASAWNDGSLLKALPYVRGAIFVDGFFLYSFQPAARRFVNEYRDAYGDNPGILEAYGYDAARILLNELRAGAADRERMLLHLRFPRLISGATGWTLRRADGTYEKQLFLLEVKEGTVREIERAAPPAPAFQAPAGGEAGDQAPAASPWRRPEWDSRRQPREEPPRDPTVPILRPGEHR